MHNYPVNGFYRVGPLGIPGVEESTKGEVCEILDHIELIENWDEPDVLIPGYNVLMLSGPDEGMEFYVEEEELVEMEEVKTFGT